jgi:hypothetical protein
MRQRFQCRLASPCCRDTSQHPTGGRAASAPEAESGRDTVQLNHRDGADRPDYLTYSRSGGVEFELLSPLANSPNLGNTAMQDTKFWRIVAVVVCVGLFYVGHGLHNRGGDGLPSLVNLAHAGGVAVDHPPEHGVGVYHIYTADESGTMLHVWTVPVGGKPTYEGTANTDGKFAVPRKPKNNGNTFEAPAQKP